MAKSNKMRPHIRRVLVLKRVNDVMLIELGYRLLVPSIDAHNTNSHNVVLFMEIIGIKIFIFLKRFFKFQLIEYCVTAIVSKILSPTLQAFNLCEQSYR